MDRGCTSYRTVELLSGASRAELDEKVLRLLENHIDPTGVPRFLYLSPTRRKNREMTERLRLKAPSWKPIFMVPATLAEQIVDRSEAGGIQWVTPELKELLVLDILERARDKGGMDTLRFKDRPTPAGIARHLIAALDAFYRRGLTPLGEDAGLSDAVGRDLEAARIALEAILRDHRLLDPDRVLGLATACLGTETAQPGDSGCAGFPAGLPADLELLVLDGFVAPDKVEADFLIALAHACSRPSTVLTMPSQAVDEIRARGWEALSPEFRLFRHGRYFFEQIGVDFGGRTGVAAERLGAADCLHGRTATDPAAGADFDNKSSIPAKAGSGEIGSAGWERKRSLTTYPDRVSEVKGLARSIKRIFFARQGNGSVNPEDFHVILPRMGPYYRLIIEIFPRYGIPFNITRGIPLSSIPVVGLIQALMDAAVGRDHDSLFRFFGSDLVRVPPDGTAEEYDEFVRAHALLLGPEFASARAEERAPQPTLDVALLDRVCRAAGITGGSDFLEDWLAPFVRHFHRRIVAGREAREPDYQGRIASEFRCVLDQLWLLHREFAQMHSLAQPDSAQAVIRNFQTLLDRYGLYGNLVRSLVEVEEIVHVGRQIMFEKNIKGFTKAMELLFFTGRDLDATGSLGSGLETIRRLFSERCRREMIQEAGELAGVSISQALEIRNLAAPVVFLAGMTAGDFPDTAARNFLLPSGPDTEAFARAVDTSRFILAHVMRECDEVHISCPAAEAGEPLEISPLVDELGLAEPITDEGEFFSGREILEAVGCAWRDEEPLPWDRICELLKQFRPGSDRSAESFPVEVRRALAAGLLRSRKDQPGPYDGIIRDPAVLLAINDLLDRPGFSYSVSMLHTYLRCPLAFFFQRILGIEPVKEIPEELEASEIGSVVHEILARFFAHRSEPVRSADRVDACCRMLETAQVVLDSHDFLSKDLLDAWAIKERITKGLYPSAALDDDLKARLNAGTDLAPGNRGYLRVLLDHETKLELGLRPWKVEADFGFSGGSRLVIPAPEGRLIRVIGRIDRVDTGPAGDSSRLLWVYDYKTGRIPSPTDVKAGKDLQLQLYLLAAKELLADSGCTDVGACFLTLKPGENDLRKSMLVTPGVPKALRTRSSWELSDEDLENVKEIVRGIDSSIRRGDFPRAADEQACKHCDYVSACFRDEHRIRMLTL
ncbi:MAG: PD-(D/E)XK nuclease family protein [Thermodesulfobacteriota bacterium]